MKNETFSIVMPAWNSELTIAESIRSVLNQYYQDFKLYIVDDHSTDATANIVKEFFDKRIIYLKNKDTRGVAHARNKALDIVTGRYVAFLDSDDIWLPDKLALQLDALQAGYDLVFAFYYTFRDSPEKLLQCRKSPRMINMNLLLKMNLIGNLTGVYNSSKLGVVRQKDIGHEDYVMWLEIIKKTGLAYCIQKPLALYRLSHQSLSANKLKAARWQWNIYRKELKFSLIKSTHYFSCYAGNSIFRRLIDETVV